MGYLLVTNDDGVDSPALRPLIRALAELGEVRAVVPAEERSWISKAITRWDRVRARRVQSDGFEIVAIEGGYPADCTNLAVHSLYDEPPEAVVSGINLFFACIVLLNNLFIDLIYAYLDPRIRYQ